MKTIKIKLFDSSMPLPSFKSKGAACVDLYSSLDITVKSKSIEYIPLNVAVKIPDGYFGLLCARSSTHKIGLVVINGIGIIDSDFCGNDDQIKLAVYNFTEKNSFVKKGDRIAQLTIVKYENFTFKEVKKLKLKNRGGFGSTGKKM